MYIIMEKLNKVEIKMKYAKKLWNYGKITVIIKYIIHI